MADSQTAVKAASALKALIQKPMDDAQRKAALGHLDELIKCYCESRAELQQTAVPAEAPQTRELDSGTNFRFDWPDMDLCCVVGTTADNAEPIGLGYAYFDGGQPVLETTWAPHCMTLGDWHKVLRFIEDNRSRVPAARSTRLEPLP
jgi:hypothetical protein